nr:PREDICTED: uncharacterized protein LOC107076733 [Lepisosteus oculatus]XP_015197205.1 PREDICTED: uncharacterized protein LOC107076733 [Lepisosteus oculatus]
MKMILLRATLTAAILLFAASSTSCLKVQFPGLHTDVEACLQRSCARNIDVCGETHGQALTNKLKGCIVQKCQTMAKRCIRDVFNTFATFIDGPYSSEIKTIGEILVEYFVQYYMECWQTMNAEDLKETAVCVANKQIDKVQPVLTHFARMIFKNPEYMSCWLTKSMKGIVMCYDHHYDTKDLMQSKMFTESRTKTNLAGYLSCLRKGFLNAGPECQEMFEAMLAVKKGKSLDYFLCSLQEVIVATAKC